LIYAACGPSSERSDAPIGSDASVLPPDAAADAGVTGFGDPCNSNGNCASGYCVEKAGTSGGVCTKECNNDCPTGWDCKSDHAIDVHEDVAIERCGDAGGVVIGGAQPRWILLRIDADQQAAFRVRAAMPAYDLQEPQRLRGRITDRGAGIEIRRRTWPSGVRSSRA
jgi:hypothetical protein